MPKMLTDPKIKVDRATSKKIAEIISKEIEDSFAANGNVYKLAKRSQNQYNQITKWMEADKICSVPWPGAADYFIPMTEWIVDAVHARAMQILFSEEPYMTAQGVESSDVPKQEGVTDFVDMAFKEIINLYENMRFFIKQTIILPFAVLKYDWVKKYDSSISKETAQMFISPEGEEEYVLPDDPESQIKAAQFVMNGYQLGETKDVWIREDDELENQAKLQYVKFEDYAWSPHAKRGHRLFWEGDRYWMTINEMKMEAQSENYIKESVERVQEGLHSQGMDELDAIIAQKSKPVECFHWYGRLPFNKSNDVDFQDVEAIEQEVYCAVALKEKETLQIIFWPYSRKPYPDRVYIRGEFEETEEFEGRSLVQKLYMTQKELNSMHNTIMNNAWIAMQKIFVKRRTLQGEDWERPELYPGVTWEVDQPGDIQVLDVGDVKSIGLEIEQSLLNYAERISNISIMQTGATREKGGQKTLGEVQATIKEGNIGLNSFIKRSHEVLKKICKWTVAYYQERMPEGLERRIRGENGEPIFPTQENMPQFSQNGVNPQWSQDDIAGQFDFTWNGTVLNSSKEWKLAVANDLMERYLPQPMIAGNLLAVWEILKRGLIARGEKDWNTILPPREAILAEMERAQEIAKIRRKGNQMPTVEERAAQKFQQATGGQAPPLPGGQNVGTNV